MEHYIYRTQTEKQKANELCLKQECINKIARDFWLTHMDNKFEKIKDLDISLWEEFHSEHRKKINNLIDQELPLPLILKWKIKNQSDVLIQSVRYFYLVYLQVPNEQRVNNIIQDQEIEVHNLVWLKCGMVDRQRSLIKIMLPKLDRHNSSDLFAIGHKFCLPQLLVQVYQVSGCKIDRNLVYNDTYSCMYTYFVCYCKIYIQTLNKARQDEADIDRENESSSGKAKPKENENINNDSNYTTNNTMHRVRDIEEHTEFKTELNALFRETSIIGVDRRLLRNREEESVLYNLLNNYDNDLAFTIHSLMTKNKMAFEYFWQRVDDKDKQGLCDYLVGYIRTIPTFENGFYFLVMYEYMPLNFKHFIENNESMKELNQFSIFSEYHTSSAHRAHNLLRLTEAVQNLNSNCLRG